MSVEMVVFLEGSRLPDARTWAEAIRQAGFSMELDAEVDVKMHSGFWPCRYEGADAGFEFLAGDSRDHELERDLSEAVGDRDLAVSLVTHSDMRELMTSVISGLVLASMADGVFWDTEGNEITGAVEGLARAKAFEAETRPLLERFKRR